MSHSLTSVSLDILTGIFGLSGYARRPAVLSMSDMTVSVWIRASPFAFTQRFLEVGLLFFVKNFACLLSKKVNVKIVRVRERRALKAERLSLTDYMGLSCLTYFLPPAPKRRLHHQEANIIMDAFYSCFLEMQMNSVLKKGATKKKKALFITP